MKYKKIYDVIHASDCNYMSDLSYWNQPNMDIVKRNRPLWIILENRRINKRIWVTHAYKKLELTTAQLDLNCKSSAYHESIRRYVCENQTDMASKLKKILDGNNVA